MMPVMAGEVVAERIRARTDWRQPKLALVSSVGVPMRRDRAASAGFDAFLTKPVRYQALLECLSGLWHGDEAPNPVHPTDLPPDLRPPDLRPTDLRPAAAVAPAPAAPPAIGRGHVLLAEDNEVNTLLATTLLEGAGYTVDCVVNGVAAVAAVESTRYDLVLMDVQMPEMNGLEASAAIRKLGGAAAAVPIVAMTANAMRSDQDVCLAAGMNDFIAKPIDVDGFLALVAQYVRPGRVDRLKGRPFLPGDPPVLDESVFDGLSRMLPPARLRPIVETYLDGADSRLSRIEAAARVRDWVELEHEAHDLKSTSGSFGARRLQSLAEQLQTAGKANDHAALTPLIDAIRDASDQASVQLGRKLAELQPMAEETT